MEIKMTAATYETGTVISRRLSELNWTMRSGNEITEEDARKAQAEAGYHPGGYDFKRFSCSKNSDGTYMARWVSYNNCD